MKYKLFIIPLLVLLITGCGKEKVVETLTCTYENTNEGTEYKTVTKADVNEKGIIINATSTMTFKDQSLAEEMCDNFKATSDSQNVSCDGTTITIKNYHDSLRGDKDLMKDDFLDYMDNRNYKCD